MDYHVALKDVVSFIESGIFYILGKDNRDRTFIVYVKVSEPDPTLQMDLRTPTQFTVESLNKDVTLGFEYKNTKLNLLETD